VQKADRSDDVMALSALLAIIFIAVGFRWRYDNWLSDYDRLSQFLPWFGYVGERLRDFQVPAWNPADSSGAPFAGSPNSGWMYLPIMIPFALFKVITAYKVLVLLHALIGGLATYFFARILRLGPFPALFAATTFAIGPMLYGATMYATPSSLAMVFYPVCLLGFELSIRANRWSSRLGWAAFAGIGIVQVFTGSPPRFVYGMIFFGGWLAYRALFSRIEGLGDLRDHLRRVIWTSIATGIFALSFGLAIILPIVDFSNQANVKGGDYSNVLGGNYVANLWTAVIQVKIHFQDWDLTQRPLFISATIFVLCLIAVFLGRNRFGIPLFALDVFLMLDLATEHSLTRWFFYLFPGFEQVTSHRPTAAPLMMLFSTAMLAGAGIQLLLERPFARSHLLAKLIPLPIFLLLILWAERAGPYPMGKPQIVVVVIATLILLLPWLPLPRRWPKLGAAIPQTVVVLLLLLSLAYPTGWDFLRTLKDPTAAPDWTNPIAYDPDVAAAVERIVATSEPGTTAGFLQQQQANTQPFRYAPYFPNEPEDQRNPVPAAAVATDPGIIEILANARANRLGLQQISGYNAVHLDYYVDYIDVMNGKQQDYHYLDVYIPAVNGSQLLNMLNVRYVLIPNGIAFSPSIVGWGKKVFQGTYAAIYENPNAFPRAWIMHDVQPDQDGAELQLLNSGKANGRTTAFVHGDLPPVSPPDPAAPRDSAIITSYAPERIELAATANGDGLLVLSEVYANGWNAWVDGEKVDILRTNHALRGVPLSAGQHTVVLKYEPMALRFGLWSTGLSSIAMIGVWIWALLDGRKRRRVHT
jgi:hypothetical protein